MAAFITDPQLKRFQERLTDACNDQNMYAAAVLGYEEEIRTLLAAPFLDAARFEHFQARRDVCARELEFAMQRANRIVVELLLLRGAPPGAPLRRRLSDAPASSTKRRRP